MNKLRQALGDVAAQPRYVETLPGVGYRFVAPVQGPLTGVLELVPPYPALDASLPQRRGVWSWIGGAVVLLALFAGGGWIVVYHSKNPPVQATQFRITPPNGYFLEGSGIRQSFALSPDGEWIAFTAKGTNGAFRLFLRRFSELESRPVPDSEGAYSVVWTPDGRELLYTTRGNLHRIAIPSAISQLLSNKIPYFSSAIPFGPKQVLVSNHSDSALMPSAGGIPVPTQRKFPWVQMLPGGRNFLYSILDPELGAFRARIAAVGANEEGVEVVQADSRVQYTESLHSDGGYLLYLRAGTLLAQRFNLATRRVTGEPKALAHPIPSFGRTGAADFTVSQRGMLAYQSYVARSQYIWVDRAGKRLSAASPAGINAKYARVSPDGRWIAGAPYHAERGVPEIWLYDAVTAAGRKLTFGPEVRTVPVWSPDSHRVVYVMGHVWPRLAIVSLDGTPDKEELPDTGFMVPTDWSPDGRFILYNNSALPAITRDFQSDVFAIDMVRGRKVIPLLNTAFFESSAIFSPDGKWLAFLSDESGKAEIYIQGLDRGNESLRVTGERVLISSEGAQSLRWRKDGKELFYLGADGTVYAVPLTFRGGGVQLGTREPLFTIDPEARSANHSIVAFDVSADGRRFVIPSMTPGESSALVVLRDWESLLAK